MSTTSTLRPVRKLALVLAASAVAGLGTVLTAPAAVAAPESVPVEQDGGAYVVEGNGKGGPDYFIVLGNKKIPVFFCDPEKPNKRHNNCIPDPVEGPRF
jgi:hypothetical protein